MVVYLLLFAFVLNAQEILDAPQAKLITKFSFTQLSGGIIIINASIDDKKDTLNFVLDTGSSGISLDSSTVAHLQFPVVESEKTIRGIAGIKKVPFTYGHRLNFEGLTTDTFSFHIVDYDLLSSVYGVRIDGIIGFSFLRRYIVKLDYNKNFIEIYSPGYIKYPKNGYLIKPDFSNLPLPNFSVEDEHSIASKFIFDTGAGLCFLLSNDFIEDSLLFRKKKKRYPTQTEGLGGKKVMELTTLKKVAIGPYKFRNVPAYVFNDSYNVCNYPQTMGIIGNDILRRFNVIINYPEQSIHLKPNDKFNENFDYSYTGMSVYMINGEVTVTDIIPNSPSDKAGFIYGDVILGVGDKFTKNIQIIKEALQHPGAELKVMILRGEKLMLLTLNVKNILR